MAGAVFGRVRLWGDDARRYARTLLERVGLGGRGSQPPAAMTYIDQKRLELARALAGNPRVLLLDEWLAGLNPSELKVGIGLVRDVRNDGRTIIMVEHVMDAIRSLCDRVVVMSSGAKIADGSAAAVLSDPAVVRAYLGTADA
jgi:branched-chain amino acid transport system ATP-binding protein